MDLTGKDNIEQIQEDWKFQMVMELIDVRAELLYLKIST